MEFRIPLNQNMEKYVSTHYNTAILLHSYYCQNNEYCIRMYILTSWEFVISLDDWIMFESKHCIVEITGKKNIIVCIVASKCTDRIESPNFSQMVSSTVEDSPGPVF